jgi:hypothetical protein
LRHGRRTRQDVDPTQFKVVDGKLYLNVNVTFKQWSENVNIAAADLNCR